MAASSLSDHLDVWTDGSLVLDHLTGVSSSGSGFLAHQAEHSWNGIVVGAMLIVFVFTLILRAVKVFVLFLGHFNLFRGLRCGVSFQPCRPLVLFTLGLTILVLFGILVGC